MKMEKNNFFMAEMEFYTIFAVCAILKEKISKYQETG